MWMFVNRKSNFCSLNSVLGFSVIVINKRAIRISVVFLCFQQGDAQKGDHGEKGEEVCDYYNANSYLVFSDYLPDPDSQFSSTELKMCFPFFTHLLYSII